MPKVIYLIFFIGFLLIYTGKATANTGTAPATEVSNDSTCKTPDTADKSKTTFCFFSLNNPTEHTTFEEKYGQTTGVEIKEFYNTTHAGKPVKERFKEMLKSGECDSLVISGHHTGYFAGKQSIHNKNRDWKLDLDFMEELSCEEGCAKWFANVKSLFLMGCQTVKSDTRLEKSRQTPDSETIRVAEKYSIIDSKVRSVINQAYSSTLAKDNPLSHRYLRMFPEASLYGWAGTSMGEKTHSEKIIPDFIQLFGGSSNNRE